MLSIPLHQRLLSYLQPVLLKRSPSDVSGFLELRLYHDRLQLLTAGALYSDGERYFPAVAVAQHLGDFLPTASRVLVLGAGLGSIVQVMRARGLCPRYTLVEKDNVVLRWTREVLDEGNERAPSGRTDQAVDRGEKGVEELLGDAEAFMARNERKYDLVFVDLFAGRDVPDFVTTGVFLRQCRAGLSPGGHLALNYLETDRGRWSRLRTAFAEVFPACHIISKDDNRILISRPALTGHAPTPG
jgi:spermidine synthase